MDGDGAPDDTVGVGFALGWFGYSFCIAEQRIVSRS